MSFGEGDLHIENEKLKERVDSLEITNGKLCAEINRQERVIERQQERIANLTVERDAYLEMVKRVQADCDARDELICDMWSGIVREHPQGGFPDMGLLEKRMRELGIEVD